MSSSRDDIGGCFVEHRLSADLLCWPTATMFSCFMPYAVCSIALLLMSFVDHLFCSYAIERDICLLYRCKLYVLCHHSFVVPL
jgi:hypothetical protein